MYTEVKKIIHQILNLNEYTPDELVYFSIEDYKRNNDSQLLYNT